ncbi:hypothetical protein LX32DRAFT_4758 [Colletotrichum zoysiae]|uniref:Uncharacterized protein n=1 Tax=Colletotrichum zoysiae TaxID=1216348 RepID=A0AAD9HUW5_9PEZI|nr:hypothetical protein LX32DRAFT_4758 [Colletotrichum zoysiae]
MKLLYGIIISTMAICAVAKDRGPPCPTVTSIKSICSTFVQPACLALSTIQNRCGCPSVVPTTTVNYPCKGPRPTGCMGTSYVYETATPTCDVPIILTPTPSINISIIPIIPTPVVPEACPTVFTKKTVCSTCVHLQCVRFSTISRLCHCPTIVPTVTQAFPCGGRCPGGCGGTVYIEETQTPVCTSVT